MSTKNKSKNEDNLFKIKGKFTKQLDCEHNMIFTFENDAYAPKTTAPTISYMAHAWEPMFQSEFDACKFGRKDNAEKLKNAWLQRKTYYNRLNDHKLFEPKFPQVKRKSCKICQKEFEDHLEHLNSDDHKINMSANPEFKKLLAMMKDVNPSQNGFSKNQDFTQNTTKISQKQEFNPFDKMVVRNGILNVDNIEENLQHMNIVCPKESVDLSKMNEFYHALDTAETHWNFMAKEIEQLEQYQFT